MDVELSSLHARASLHRALSEPHRLAMADALALSDLTPTDLGALTGLASNLLGFHLRELERAGVIERRSSDGDRRRRYVRLRPAALDVPAGVPPRRPGRPLFVCTRNSARSQFAAGLWRARTAGEAASAGGEPAAEVHPLAVAAARAHGVDLSGAAPRGYEEVREQPDLVVSVCDRALERGLPFAAPRIHWSVPDPVGGGPAAFDAVFSEVAERIERLAERAAA